MVGAQFGLEEWFKRYHSGTLPDWPEVLTNLKRLGLKYVRDERIKYDCDGTSISERGVIHGLKFICDLAEGEDVSRCHA